MCWKSGRALFREGSPEPEVLGTSETESGEVPPVFWESGRAFFRKGSPEPEVLDTSETELAARLI
jgi:hypothetical protein